jgi:hypothetical protein
MYLVRGADAGTVGIMRNGGSGVSSAEYQNHKGRDGCMISISPLLFGLMCMSDN